MSKPPIVFLVAFTVVCFLAPNVSTQTQSPPVAPNTQDEVIRVSTELVQTGVTVVDKQGRFVEGLDRDQFELRVNGKEQPVAFFERVVAGSNKEFALLTSNRSRPTPARENEQPASPSAAVERGRTTFLFLDDLHLSASSMARTKELLLNYVDNVMGPKDQAVIATASGQLGFLQQLTGDRAMLRLAVNRLTYRPFTAGDTITSPAMSEYQAVAIENGDRDALSYFTDKQCEEFKREGRGNCAPDTGLTNNAVYDDAVARGGRGGTTSGTSPGPLPVDPQSSSRGGVQATSGAHTVRATADREVRARARIIARQAAQVTLNTLSSLESLIRTSSSIRERKLAIFISDGFFLNFLRSNNAYDLRRIADAALRSGMVIYTIDARGLVTGSPDAATKDGFDPQGRSTRLAMAEVTAAQDPLHALAADTGGRALFNSNDLQSSLSTALQETSAYYLLAWRPDTAEAAKDPFRRIEVSVKNRPDLTVRVQGGFFNEDPGAHKANAGESASSLSVDDQLMAAIRATYPSRGIPITVSLGYLDNGRDGLMLAVSAQIAPEPGSAAQAADFDVIGAVIDDGGNILSSLKQKVTVPAEQIGNAKAMVVTLQFPKMAPGLRQVRIAARDSRSGRIGSTTQWIEIPNLTQGDIALSSIFLSEGAPSGSSQKTTIKPDARFTQTGKLRFQTHVYNAASSAASARVMMQVELRRNGQLVTQTPPSAVPTEGVKDLSHIPVVGEFPLQSFPPGEYQLSISVTDQSTKKSASQQVTFIVQ